MSPIWAGCDLRGGTAPGQRHEQSIPTWTNLLAFPSPARGSVACVLRWVACAKQKGVSVSSLSTHTDTFEVSLDLLWKLHFLFFPLVSLVTPKQTHIAMSPGSQLHFPADT